MISVKALVNEGWTRAMSGGQVAEIHIRSYIQLKKGYKIFGLINGFDYIKKVSFPCN